MLGTDGWIRCLVQMGGCMSLMQVNVDQVLVRKCMYGHIDEVWQLSKRTRMRGCWIARLVAEEVYDSDRSRNTWGECFD